MNLNKIAALFLSALLASSQVAYSQQTVRSIDEIYSLLPGGQEGAISARDLRDAIASLDDTGWGGYTDTANPCSGTPQSITADTDTVLTNNAGGVLETYKPSDVTTFYDGSVIMGRTGDGLLITVDMKATPAVSATYIEIWFDIGGSIGELYRRILTFPKGNGVARPINFTVSGYTLDTWQTNGATVYVRSDGAVDLCDKRYVITRTHRGSR